MGWIFWIITLACWGAFCLVWFAGWVYNLMRGPDVQRRARSIPFWLTGLVVVLVVLLVRGSGFRFLRPAGTLPPPWVLALGAGLLVPSTLFTLWARFSLGTMWSSSPEAKVGHQLRTDGPYGITRHPIYTGMLGMLLGSLLVAGIGPWAALIVMGAVVVLLKIPTEERLMIDTFGDRYREYQQRVPQVIPGIKWPSRTR
jgi:protein-S-isoprenylcysteine O-methyltransferase Ste14